MRLFMSREIVKFFNGEICYLSKVDKGICFIFSNGLENNCIWNEIEDI
jgi:hypothetical protein